jgi:hypothetical protein
MQRILHEVSRNDLFNETRSDARLIVARESEFQRREGEIDPADIGPIVCRQPLWCATRERHYSKEGLIVTPPPQPSDEPPRFPHLDIIGRWSWEWSFTTYWHYLCPKNEIVAAFREVWLFPNGVRDLGSYVAVLSDCSLKPSSN